jgi:hypothetical protein
VRCDVAAVRVLLVCYSAATAGAQGALPAPRATGAYEMLINAIACRQQPSGRMDCEYSAGNGLRFAVTGVGQEDVVISVTHTDSSAEFYASVAPLHGCVVVKPLNGAEFARRAGVPVADSTALSAFVSPRTGKVYRNWQGCLGATRREGGRADLPLDSARQAAHMDSLVNAAAIRIANKADSISRARAASKAPPVRPPKS